MIKAFEILLVETKLFTVCLLVHNKRFCLRFISDQDITLDLELRGTQGNGSTLNLKQNEFSYYDINPMEDIIEITLTHEGEVVFSDKIDLTPPEYFRG